MGKIVRVSGPLVIAEGLADSKMYDLVYVGEQRLVGEIIELRGDKASIQVYEETAGLGPGDPVVSSNAPLSVELGPGLIGAIYDGIQRPLEILREKSGSFLERGLTANALDRQRQWLFQPLKQKGEQVKPGDILGVVKETEIIEHKIMVPPKVEGELFEINAGEFAVEDTVAKVKQADGQVVAVNMIQRWPVRLGRPYEQKLPPSEPLVTGQRVIDTFFPITKGGTACVPGPFGAGKTVIQHEIAKWSNAQIIVFIGCGERGNEMTDVLIEFPKLIDPYSGRPLMERTVLIANTSNMPVAAREASIYTGIAIAEYFRDMGYDVALQADSTSRWAEALREISGRLEEMPGEEGYPAYLSSRLAAFYERAGMVKALGSPERTGSVTAIGSVSPPGGDLSEPVVQSTLRVTKVFWALEDRLAYERHFPAINWLVSYSLYLETAQKWLKEKIASDYQKLRSEAMRLLQLEAELKEIVRLVGLEALSVEERVILETARSLREDFLQQNAFHEVDTFCSLKKQYLILKLIMTYHEQALKACAAGRAPEDVSTIPVREKIARAKYLPEKELDKLSDVEKELIEQLRVEEVELHG